jgi:Amt family ammonium transporter
MPDIQKAVEGLQTGGDVLFLLMGAVLVFAMHGGFAFLEAGTVRHKNQVNALCKILVDFAISTVAYFFIGYTIAYGVAFLANAEAISGGAKGFDSQGLTLVKFFFLATFAAAVPAIVSGGIAERARFGAQCAATALIVGFAYPFFEGIVWNKNHGLQETFFKGMLGEEFHDFAGSIVVHAVGGWIGFSAVRQLGPRLGRFKDGRAVGIPPSWGPGGARGGVGGGGGGVTAVCWLYKPLTRLASLGTLSLREREDHCALATASLQPGDSAG